MTLEDLGYDQELEEYRKEHNLDTFSVGRVISEHKDRYSVKTESDEYDTELIGNLRFSATNRNDLPAVGDWVAISEYEEGKALIHAVLPRKSVVERKAVGKLGQQQIIATNIDIGLIVQSVNRDFNINRLERYLTICNASKIDPIVILSKADLVEKSALEILVTQVVERIKNVPVYAISNYSHFGMDQLISKLCKGKTYCLLGSSGVGKSTLINNLTGKDIMTTGAISQSIDRGKHITSHRELIVLEKGGIFIDNPGMREVGIADTSGGLETTFETIFEYAKNCMYKNCSHTHEMGCAVLAALDHGGIDEDSYANFRKMEKEKIHFESDALERKRKEKYFGRLSKRINKNRKKNKF